MLHNVAALKMFMWGGGHTTQTDPCQQGWRAHPIKKGSHVLLAGRRGQRGCFTARRKGDGRIDLCVHSEQSVDQILALVGQQDPDYGYDMTFHVVEYCSGWGLEAIQILRRQMAIDDLCR